MNFSEKYFHTRQETPEQQEFDPWKNLAATVVLQAVFDFFDLKYQRRQPVSYCNLDELERFFHSDWFKQLTRIPGGYAWEHINTLYSQGKDIRAKNIRYGRRDERT